jgi:PRTRC genetic system protein A
MLDIEPHPRIPQTLMERIVAFFDLVATRHRAEAAVLLLWDRRSDRMTVAIPHQRATVVQSSMGGRYPTDVHYEVPALPPHVVLVGDVHSHVDGAAYASYTDRTDETYRAGLHVVLGRIHREPPEIHAEFVVDGERFAVHPPEILEGYHERSPSVPGAWVDRVRIDLLRPGHSDDRDRWEDREPRSAGAQGPKRRDRRSGRRRCRRGGRETN